jgi:hypothetical protein
MPDRQNKKMRNNSFAVKTVNRQEESQAQGKKSVKRQHVQGEAARTSSWIWLHLYLDRGKPNCQQEIKK